MAVIVFDYGKCNGKGECVKRCSIDLLELDQNGRFCKPKDEEVENKEVIEEFYKKVYGTDQSNVKIAFELVNCAECYSCEKFCPEQAIEVKEEK